MKAMRTRYFCGTESFRNGSSVSFSELFCHNKDISRFFIIENKLTQETKTRRKGLRAIRKGFADANEVQEELTYGSGEF